MDQLPDKQFESNPEEEIFLPGSASVITYPPKFEKKEQSSNIWLRSFTSLALYLILGYYIFPSYKILLLITAIVMIHELGHFFAMKFFHYNDLGIFFIPLLGAYVSGSKRQVSQKQSAIILLAGPLPGIIIGITGYLLWQNNTGLSIAGISLYTVSLSFIILNLINLIPVYPLDGGQLLNRVFLDEESKLSKIFIFLSIGFLCWIALFAMNKPFYPLLIFPAMMLFRLFGDKKITEVEKRVEAEGLDTDLEYKDLPDEDYWKIRKILIEEHASFKDVESGPPYEYSGSKEEKIMIAIQSLLHRHLIQDVSLMGKILILLIWIAAIASPWLLKMDMSFLNRFGF
ncbi:MAG: site-2 protease family protein [Chitinophagaceae bacterium]